jgi:hypothetical protein
MEKNKIDMNAVNQKLAALMQRPDGLSIFLSKITSPLRIKRDLVSGLRKVLQYDPLDQGDVPVYDLDPQGYAYIIPYQGAAPLRIQPDESSQVVTKTFDMIAFKEFPVSNIRRARYQYLRRIETQLKNSIVELEDTELYKLLEATVTDANYPLTPVAGTLADGVQPDEAADVYGQVENFTDPKFFIGSSVALSPIRTWGADIFSPVRRESILKTGVIGYVWGAALYKSRVFPNNRIYLTGEPELLGRIPEYMSLEPHETKSPRKGKQEIAFIQNLGIVIYNGYAANVVNLT